MLGVPEVEMPKDEVLLFAAGAGRGAAGAGGGASGAAGAPDAGVGVMPPMDHGLLFLAQAAAIDYDSDIIEAPSPASSRKHDSSPESSPSASPAHSGGEDSDSQSD